MAEKGLSGLYHVVSGEKISKYAFGRQIANRLSLDASLITPISYQDAGLKARRSPNLFLDITKLQATGIAMPTIDQGLDDFIKDYREGWHTALQGYLA
jgi:dTDP-4-dehydrorhamnose reductase